MWGEPREGTEAYTIKKEAERLQKIAEDKGFDKLFSEAYHDSIFAYGSWVKDKRNKRYVHPKVTNAKESNIKRGDKSIKRVDFTLDENKYGVEEYTYSGLVTDEHYVDLDLYLNGKKVFAITETETSDEWTNNYHPVSVKAYVNEDWVDDLSSIREHRKDTDKQVELDFAESPDRVKKLKEDFGITEIKNTQVKVIPVWKKWWFWIVILMLYWILSSS